MADFNAVSIKLANPNNLPSAAIGSGGSNEQSKRMLGEAGAGVTGNGSWIRSRGLWKTFYLYAADRLAASDIAAAVVTIDACMELPDSPPNDVDTDVEFTVIATLNAAGPSFSLEEPWRFLRARVTIAGADPCQVGMVEQGT